MKEICTQTMFLGLLASMLLIMPVRGAFCTCNLKCHIPVEASLPLDNLQTSPAELITCHGNEQPSSSQDDSQSNSSDAGCECSYELQITGMDDLTLLLRQHEFITYSNSRVDSRGLATVSPPPRHMCN
jgi:hypothetical protein